MTYHQGNIYLLLVLPNGCQTVICRQRSQDNGGRSFPLQNHSIYHYSFLYQRHLYSGCLCFLILYFVLLFKHFKESQKSNKTLDPMELIGKTLSFSSTSQSKYHWLCAFQPVPCCLLFYIHLTYMISIKTLLIQI